MIEKSHWDRLPDHLQEHIILLKQQEENVDDQKKLEADIVKLIPSASSWWFRRRMSNICVLQSRMEDNYTGYDTDNEIDNMSPFYELLTNAYSEFVRDLFVGSDIMYAVCLKDERYMTWMM